ncbi:MupA/Atu3671 family FMN-dependent luciferase-like monooxygenase [Actinomadura terrae]|uniref:MupA/Atu3671 family FMN-dependent luciferase-like monooxygenase n=1 Tax=Actinomadura terrae TaxID=604353 RepID=UPI001FA7BA12|nr:MupA/Atu3671 family FMN-dependent luciferase-like monooxygenase [Actinomadura terrae]
MDLSLFYFANDSTASGGGGRYDLLMEGARYADVHGFSAVWTPERHFHPFGGSYPNPSVLGAAVAAITENVAIRAGSVVSPLHHPLRIAEEWSVVDNLSGGRVGLAFASGWNAVDFALAPDAYEGRRQTVIDSVHTVRKLWRGETLAATDGRGRDIEVRAYPPPVQDELPVWVTAARGIDTFRAAAKLKAGVLTHVLGQSPEELAAKIAEYRRVAAAEHDGWQGHVVLMLHTLLGDDLDQVRRHVDAPFRAYLKSSLHLFASSLVGGEIDVSTMNADDVDFLIEKAFERYFPSGGLFGTIEQAVEVVEMAAAIGVDELACLIDFGVDGLAALAGLEHLGKLHSVLPRG